MGKVKDENFIVIQGWMLNELNLKGTELLVYAIIYGFSQDDESYFTGSRSYLAEWCNATLPTIDFALKKLLDKNLIEKKIEVINGITFNRYKKTLQGIKKLYGGYKETLSNNIDNNIDNLFNVINNKKIEVEKDNSEQLIKELNKLGIEKKKLLDRMKILRKFIKDKNISPNEESRLREYILNIENKGDNSYE